MEGQGLGTATVRVFRWVVVVSAAVVLGLVGVHWANASEHRVTRPARDGVWEGVGVHR